MKIRSLIRFDIVFEVRIKARADPKSKYLTSNLSKQYIFSSLVSIDIQSRQNRYRSPVKTIN